MSKFEERKPEERKSESTEAAERPEYQWPPVRDPKVVYRDKSRHPVQSILTALPILMLVIGFFLYYRSESQQTHGVPIIEESVFVTGVYTGLSATSGRHYLWIERDDVAKGIRVKEEQLPQLETLEKGESVELKIAPKVSQSKTFWALHVEQSGQVFLDIQKALK